ncbi:MAG: hypothetical protein K2X38_25280 [Gemmataceae bacterium]|nr:hypothetical protein [Gemmataceae bacterium]
MLADRHLELLTAFVDGVLTGRDREKAHRLLHESAEARDFVRKLQENASRIKALPRRKLSPEFTAKVVAALPKTTRAVPAKTVQPMVKPSFAWGKAIVAACVMLAIGGAAFMAIPRPIDADNPQLIAKNAHPQENELPKEPVVPIDRPQPVTPRKTPAVVPQVIEGIFAKYLEPLESDYAQRFAFADLTKEDPQRSRLAAELKKEDAYHLNITAKNNGRTLERLRAVFDMNNIPLTIDPQAQANAAKGKTFVVYLENVKQDDVAAILRDLGRDDNQGKTSVKSVFESVLLSSFTSSDRAQLSKLLGIDAKQLEKPATPSAKQGPAAVAVPPSGSVPSAEVRKYLESRPAPRPGALRIMIEVHPH